MLADLAVNTDSGWGWLIITALALAAVYLLIRIIQSLR